MNINVKKMNEIKIKKVIKALERRQILGYYCETKEEASDMVVKLLEGCKSVSWGGSASLDEIGIRERLEKMEGIEAYDPYAEGFAAATKEKRIAGIMKDAYLMSTNAITLDGVMLNIDGTGNRLAAITFMANKIIIVAGSNKIANDVNEAYCRVKNIASPANAIRLGLDTPCTHTGLCAECVSKDCICSDVLFTRFSNIPGRIHVILVNENLGF